MTDLFSASMCGYLICMFCHVFTDQEPAQKPKPFHSDSDTSHLKSSIKGTMITGPTWSMTKYDQQKTTTIGSDPGLKSGDKIEKKKLENT